MRKNINTTLNKELYDKIRILAIQTGKNANDLIEEGMEYVLKKYSNEKSSAQWVELPYYFTFLFRYSLTFISTSLRV